MASAYIAILLQSISISCTSEAYLDSVTGPLRKLLLASVVAASP